MGDRHKKKTNELLLIWQPSESDSSISLDKQ